MKQNKVTKKLKRVVIYYRYSRKPKTDSSNNNYPEFHQATANSEVRQRKDCEEFAVQNGWEIVEWVGDKETPGDLEKPNLNDLAARCKNGEIEFDSILVREWSRLTRKGSIDIYQDVGWIRDENKTIEICFRREIDLNDSYSVEEAVREAHWANLEIERLSERVISGSKAKLLNKELGFQKAPFGFDKSSDSKTLIPNQDSSLVKKIFETALDRSISECIPIMSEGKKYTEPNRNGKWILPNAASIKQVLRNPIYIGIRTHGVQETGKHNTYTGKKVTEHFKNNKLANKNVNINQLEDPNVIKVDYRDKIVPLVEEKLFKQIQSKLDKQKTNKKRNNNNSQYRYVGKVKCQHCKGYLSGQTSRKGTVSYVCKNSKTISSGRCNDGLGNKMIHESVLDELFFRLFKDQLKDFKFHLAAYKYCKNIYENEMFKSSNQFESQKVKYERAVDNFANFQAENITELQTPAINKTKTILSQKVKDLEKELEKFEKKKPNVVSLINALQVDIDADKNSFLFWYIQPMFALAEEEISMRENLSPKEFQEDFDVLFNEVIMEIESQVDSTLETWTNAPEKEKEEFKIRINDDNLKAFEPIIEWIPYDAGLKIWKEDPLGRYFRNLPKPPKNIPSAIFFEISFGIVDNYANVTISSTGCQPGKLLFA